MNRVIIESPYAGDVEQNIAYARQALLHSISLGEAPFASHLLYTQVLDDMLPEERIRGIQAGYEWMASADIVAFYTDLGWSKGMIRALRMARVLLKRQIEVRGLRVEAKPPQEVLDLLARIQRS